MTSYPVVQINKLLAHLTYFSTNPVFKFFYNYEVKGTIQLKIDNIFTEMFQMNIKIIVQIVKK